MFTVDNLMTVLVGVIALLVLAVVLKAPVLVDVKIYENREDGSIFYCATGTLTDPPFRYVGAGSVPKGDESYC